MVKVFNPAGTDLTSDRQMWGGNSTGLINLNNVKYEWAVQLWRQMREQFWIAEKVDLTLDVRQYNELTPSEVRAFDGILAYLVFLDSVQVQNIPHLVKECTAPEIRMCFSEQLSQETLHSQSYAYMIETILPREKKDYIYDYWRDDTLLLERCEVIGSYYQKYVDNPSKENHTIALVADYILEGLYFYVGFAFFYNLASRSLMGGSADIFRYINKDELSHVRLYQKILQEQYLDEDLVYKMFDDAVRAEIKWSQHIIGEDILGITVDAIEQYLKYLANTRLRAIGLNNLYEDVSNPFKHLERIADTGKDANVKTNFFDATVTSYQQSSVLEWNF